MKSAPRHLDVVDQQLRLFCRETMRFRQSLSSTVHPVQGVDAEGAPQLLGIPFGMRFSMRSKGTHWLKK